MSSKNAHSLYCRGGNAKENEKKKEKKKKEKKKMLHSNAILNAGRGPKRNKIVLPFCTGNAGRNLSYLAWYDHEHDVTGHDHDKALFKHSQEQWPKEQGNSHSPVS